MRIMLWILTIGLAHSASAQARIEKYEAIKNELSKFNPSTDEGVMNAVTAVGKADAAIEEFGQLSTQRSDELRSLFKMAGYALPLGLSAESMQIVSDLAGMGKSRSAFDDAARSLDVCRRKYLISESKISNGGAQDGKAAVNAAITKTGDFNYRACVVAQSKH